MGDTFLLQMVYGLDQVLAEPAHQIERKRVFTAQPLREALLPRPFHQDAGASRYCHLSVEADNILMMQAAQELGLGADAIGVRGVQRDFENEFALLALTPHDQRIGGAAATEAFDDDEATIEDVARSGGARVGCLGYRFGGTLLCFSLREVIQKLGRRADAVVHHRCGAGAYHFLEPFADPIDRIREP